MLSGERVLTAAYDGTVKMWDVRTDACVATGKPLVIHTLHGLRRFQRSLSGRRHGREVQDDAQHFAKRYQSAQQQRERNQWSGVALAETQLQRLYVSFDHSIEVIEEAMAHVGRRQVLTYAETFSEEEADGKCIDLRESWNSYQKAEFGHPISYSAYLEEFPQTANIRHHKLTKQYEVYLSHLIEYLRSFFQRTQGLEDQGLRSDLSSASDDGIDVVHYNSVKELMELGLKRLKDALGALGLKGGGTLQERAERLFLTKTTPLEELKWNHFAKGYQVVKKHSGATMAQQIQARRRVGLAETQLQRLCELLSEVIIETKAHVGRRQAATYEEMEAEREEEEVQAANEKDDEDQAIYNPLKLPMGSEKNPFPRWLYKLHGLGKEFSCEICSKRSGVYISYTGRRTFQKHFEERQHEDGLHHLGIPNRKAFHDIIKIQEAKNLWEHMQAREWEKTWRPDMEEIEDQDGNVLTRKAYSDLLRQGLI